MRRYLALDFETYLIEEEKGLLYPKPVCLSGCYDTGETFVVGNNIIDHNYGYTQLESTLSNVLDLALCSDTQLIWQNGYGFDLGVIWYHFPNLRDKLIDCLNKDKIRDTRIREQLFDLSTSGSIKGKKGSYSLLTLVRKHVGEDISKFKEGDDIWRLRYHELDGIRANDYPKEARDYCILDVELLMKIFQSQEKLRQDSGVGSMNTEGLQIKAGFVLGLITNYGLKVDRDRLDEFEFSLDNKLTPIKERLVELGLAKYGKKGNFIKENKKFIEYLLKKYPDYIQRTEPTKTHPKGQVRIDEEALIEFPSDEIIDLRKDISILEKYKNTYCKKIRKRGNIFREKYDVMKETGRTSSFIQTMPREGGIREIFIPRNKTKILTIDYSSIEACSAAQTILNLGRESKLAELLNSGESPIDFHSYVGHLWEAGAKGTEPDFIQFLSRYKNGDESATFYRKGAKPFNLSLFGGVGKDKAYVISKKQGADISYDQSCQVYDLVFDVYPELKWYRKWISTQKLSGDFERAFAYEVNGRYRNRCTYCSCANGKAMQSLAADGAKEALWLCFKMCYSSKRKIRMLAFIHDEIIFEIQEGLSEDMRKDAETMSRFMCRGMKKVIPDIRITSEYAVMDRWTKDPNNHLVTGKMWID